MMLVRYFILLLFIFLTVKGHTQFADGFSKKEAVDMIALCNSFSFLEVLGTDEEIIPSEYKRIYTSPVFGMDNKFQIYQSEKVAVINIRGSTEKKLSWLENFYSAMIPAKGKISINKKTYEYCYSEKENAAVHSGYALGMLILSKDVILHIDSLNKKGIYHFIITGHSQGGALAQMLRACLENYSSAKVSKKNKFKTYAFACPMVGNKEFAEDYYARYCENNTSFTIINPADKVTLFPITYRDGSFVTSDDLKTLLFSTDSFSFKRFAFNIAINLFEKNIAQTVNYMGNSLSKEISKDIGLVEMPKPLVKINYVRTGNVIEIPSADYPRILKDSTILKNDSLMKIYKRDSEGNFYKTDLYEKENMFYQHKPYNYYTTLLKMYFPERYANLKRKFPNLPVKD